MLKSLRRSNNAWRLFFLGAALFPFLFRHLLVLTMARQKPLSRTVNLNEGQVKRLGKTLVRQLDSQAQELDSRDQDSISGGPGSPAAERAPRFFGGLPCAFSPPLSSSPPLQGFSVPLRI